MGLGETLSIASAAAWSAGVIVYKRLGETLPPMRLNLLKNLVVVAMIAPTVWLVEGFHPPPFSLGTIALALASGAIGIALADTLYFRSLNTLGAARMGIIGNLYSPFVILLSFALLGERLTILQGVGFLLVSSGVVLVNQGDSSRRIDPAALRRGLLYGALAILLMAIAVVMVKRILEREPLLWIVLLRLLGGVLGMFALFAWRGERLLPSGGDTPKVRWPIVVLAALLGQYIAMVLWLGGYKYANASVAAILNETSSVFIVLLAAALLGEKLTARKLIGVTCTLSGVACMLIA